MELKFCSVKPWRTLGRSNWLKICVSQVDYSQTEFCSFPTMVLLHILQTTKNIKIKNCKNVKHFEKWLASFLWSILAIFPFTSVSVSEAEILSAYERYDLTVVWHTLQYLEIKLNKPWKSFIQILLLPTCRLKKLSFQDIELTCSSHINFESKYSSKNSTLMLYKRLRYCLFTIIRVEKKYLSM